MPPTPEQIQKFQTIPVKTHKILSHTYHDSFTGKEAAALMIHSFQLSTEEVIEFGGYLLRGQVIEALNNRFNENFVCAANYVYVLAPDKKHNLYWLEKIQSPVPVRAEKIDENLIRDETLSQIPMEDIPPELLKAKSNNEGAMLTKIYNYIGKELCPKYVGPFSVKVLDTPCIIFNTPEYNKIILEDTASFSKFPSQRSNALDPSLIRFRADHFTVGQRKLQAVYESIINKNFSQDFFESKYIPITVKIMKEAMEDLKSRAADNYAPLDVSKFFQHVILRILSYIFLSMDLTQHPKWEKLSKILSPSVVDPKGKFRFPALKTKKPRLFFKALEDIIQERQKEVSGSKEPPADMLDSLLLADLKVDDAHSTTLRNEVICHCILSSLSHSHYTTASMLSWSLNFLYDSSLGYSDYQELLVIEIDRISNQNPHYMPEKDLSQKDCPVLTGIFKETLRMCSPIPVIMRKATQTTKLFDYTVTMDTVVIISIVGTHLHSRSWPDPQRFDPSRFFENSSTNPPVKPYSYLPMSIGPHLCRGGQTFSMCLGRILFAMFLTRFHLKLSPHSDVKQTDNLFLFPTGLQVNCYTRDKRMRGRTGSRLEMSRGEGKRQNEKKWDELRSFIKKKEYRLFIIAGTRETSGNTASVALRFCSSGEKFHFRLGKSPYPPDGILPLLQSPSKDFLILGVCMATYQGNAAPSARDFMRWLELSRARILQGQHDLKKSLSHINYFVFGCGDSKWSASYQTVPSFVDETLAMLGANRICPMGIFDLTKDNLFETYATFFQALAPRLVHSLPDIGNLTLKDVDADMFFLQETSMNIEPQVASSALQMKFVGDVSDPASIPPTSLPSIIPAGNGIHSCRILKFSSKQQKLHPLGRSSGSVLNISQTLAGDTFDSLEGFGGSANQNTNYHSMEIQLEVLAELQYVAGDSLLIYPRITNDVLLQFFNLFPDYNPDMIIKWTCNFQSNTQRRFHLPLNVPLTLRNIFTSLVDITAIPTRQFLMNLSTIVKEEDHECLLHELATENERYQNWVKANPRIRLLDVLIMYPIHNSSLDRLLEFLPALQPKAYPICSSNRFHKNYISVYVSGSLLHNPTLQYLKALQKHAAKHGTPSLFVSLKHGEPFKLPTSDIVAPQQARPLLIITNGVSISPFLSLLYEALAENMTIRAILIHCLASNETKKNFVLRRSVRKLVKVGLIEKIHLFHAPQLYQVLEDNQTILWHFMHHLNCITFIAGCNGPVLNDIMSCFVKMVKVNCTPLVYRNHKEYAAAYIQQLRNDDRFEECWF